METSAKVRDFARLCASRLKEEKFKTGLYVRIRVGPNKRTALNAASEIPVTEDHIALADDIETRLPSLCKNDPGWVECLAHGGKKPIESLPVE